MQIDHQLADWFHLLTAPADYAEEAGWYLSYADMNVTHCIEWQLAEKSAHLDGNPFVPLTRCYAQGFFPFSLGCDELILFAFGPTLAPN